MQAEKLQDRKRDPRDPSSLIIVKQLEHKRVNHEEFVKHLGPAGSGSRWDQLTADSQFSILEHGELLAASINLRTFQRQSAGRKLINTLLSNAIVGTLKERGIQSVNANDVLYRGVSKLWMLVPQLVKEEESFLKQHTDEVRRTEIVNAVNEIIEKMLDSWEAFKNKNRKLYDDKLYVAICWTSRKEVQDALIHQHTFTHKHAFRQANLVLLQDMSSEIIRIQQRKLRMLTKCILNGFRTRLKVCSQCNGGQQGPDYQELEDRYKSERTELLKPFLEDPALADDAYALAESHEDFSTLMELCHAQNNDKRLAKYTRDFKEKGFSEFKYQWYLRKNLRHKVLVQQDDVDDDMR